MESIYLQGSEDVKSAGNSIQAAAEEFGRHVSYLGEHLEMHHRRMLDLAERMERAALQVTNAAVELLEEET